MVNKCWDLFFIKLDWKSKFPSKPIFYLALNLDLIFLQIKWFNKKYQFKTIYSIHLKSSLMINTMQLFKVIKSTFNNLMNLPNLYYGSHSRQFEEKNP